MSIQSGVLTSLRVNAFCKSCWNNNSINASEKLPENLFFYPYFEAALFNILISQVAK